MGADAYTKALAKIIFDDSPAKPTTLSRSEIEMAIADISEMLKQSLHNAERLSLVEERRELRKQLEAANTAPRKSEDAP